MLVMTTVGQCSGVVLPSLTGHDLLVVNQGMSSPSIGIVEGFGGSQKTIAAKTVVVWFAGLPPGKSVALTLV
jgi:hypothetical protein